MRATTSTCAGSPLCDAQAIASSWSSSSSRSAAPLSTSGIACSSFTAERGKTGRSTSPSATMRLPFGIDDDDRAAVRRFARAAARGFDEDRIVRLRGHGRTVACASTIVADVRHCRNAPRGNRLQLQPVAQEADHDRDRTARRHPARRRRGRTRSPRSRRSRTGCAHRARGSAASISRSDCRARSSTRTRSARMPPK